MKEMQVLLLPKDQQLFLSAVSRSYHQVNQVALHIMFRCHNTLPRNDLHLYGISRV